MAKKAVLIALLCAAAGAALLFMYMKRFETETSGGPPVRVLAAQRDIPLGTAVTADMLVHRTLPQSYVEDRHIPAADAQRIIGIRVISGIRANESVLWTDLATTSEQRRDLSGLVRRGMRAITIRADVATSFGGLLRPGDRVDALLTIERSDDNPVTLPLLQNLLVLAAGTDTGGPSQPGQSSQRSSFNQVTLSVTLEQAAVLTLAQSEGNLTLILRNPDDIAVIENAPETTTDDIVERERRDRIQGRRTPPPTKAPTGPIRVTGDGR